MLQLERKLESNSEDGPLLLARRILEGQFDAFTKKHYDKLLLRLEVEEEELKVAIDEITRLNPKPGNSGSDSVRPVQAVIPDFQVSVEGDQLRLQINGRNAPELRVSNEYREMMAGYAAAKTLDRAQKEAITFVKRKVDAAKWFIDAIQQRRNTLRIAMEAILVHQEAYFLTGDETDLKPMILKDIAENIGMDISTVSRVANSKYVQTPYGTFLLKTLFSESLATDSGEEVSTREVKKILEEAVQSQLGMVTAV